MAKGWRDGSPCKHSSNRVIGLMVSKTVFLCGLFLYEKSPKKKRIFIKRRQPPLPENRFVVENHFSGKRGD